MEKAIIEKRSELRCAYSGHVFFAIKNGFYEGRLKNFSRYGLFIEANVPYSVGEVIIVALPYLNRKKTKCRGQIVWRHRNGFGLELFRKRVDSYIKLIKG